MIPGLVRASGLIIATQPERTGSQGRPVRAERSEPRSGAFDDRDAEATPARQARAVS